jgi:hypothetical protein
MTRPEDALEQARATATARRRDEGAYREVLPGFAIQVVDRVDVGQLAEFALIEPDPEEVYSTRRLGAPVTWLKKGLLRALWQYHRQITGQQTRFNLRLMTYVAELEGRIERLEERDGRPPAA